MFNFFGSILDWLRILADFIVSLFEYLLLFIKMIPSAITWLVSIMNYTPTFVVVYASFIIGFAVLLQILNKGS